MTKRKTPRTDFILLGINSPTLINSSVRFACGLPPLSAIGQFYDKKMRRFEYRQLTA